MATVTRNRVIYQSQAVYAGPDKTAKGNAGWRVETGTHEPKQLKRIQSANYSFDIARTDVNQFGELAAIDRVVLESPTVSFDTSWYACNWYNEDLLGLKVNGPNGSVDSYKEQSQTGILTDILTANADERNYYIRVVPEGEDAVGYDLASDEAEKKSAIIGIGNGFLSNYSLEAAVGGFPTASVTVEALNIAFSSGISGDFPAIDASNGNKLNRVGMGLDAADANAATHTFEITGAATGNGSSASSVTAIKPGNITVALPTVTGGANTSGIAVQSVNMGFDLSREPLNKLGSRFAFTREITFPITATCSVDCLVQDYATGNLADMINDNVDNDVVVRLDDDTDAAEHMAVVLKKAKLDSQSFSQGIGDNQTVTLNFSTQVGSKTQTDRGLFLSGDLS